MSYPDRKGYCWGANFYGQLGDGSLTQRYAPSLESGGLTFRQVTAGASFSCAVTVNDQAYCWGSNQVGQLGDGSTVEQRKRPGPVAGGHAFRQLEAGTSHSCGVTRTDKAYCWGYGRRGQLGDGKTVLRFTPRAAVGGLKFRRVAPGSGFTCAETPTSTVYCWGSNEYGQLGDGTTTRRLAPVLVAGGLRFGQVGAGGWSACGKTLEGVGYCCGYNAFGQLGDGTSEDRHTPTPIAAPGSASVREAGLPRTRTVPTLGDTLAHPD